MADEVKTFVAYNAAAAYTPMGGVVLHLTHKSETGREVRYEVALQPHELARFVHDIRRCTILSAYEWTSVMQSISFERRPMMTRQDIIAEIARLRKMDEAMFGSQPTY